MNTLKVAKQLQEAGCETKIAEVISLVIDEAIDSKASTKEDLNNLKINLEKTISDAKTELKKDIADVKTELKSEIKDLHITFYRWQIGIMLLIASAFVGQTYFLMTFIKNLLGQ